jgi:tRNA dimethylallyltransferase
MTGALDSGKVLRILSKKSGVITGCELIRDSILDMNNPIIFIAGATASGKSALAIKLARLIDGIILNCDAMQVYSDLRVITARPSDLDMGDAPHHLFGEIDGAVNFSVGHYLKAVAPYLEMQKPLIFVGGTGLYFKAMMQGLSEMPPVPDDIRETARGMLNPYAELQKYDTESAQKLNPNDSLRVLRALEIYMATGVTLPHWQRQNPPKPLLTPDIKFFLDVDRSVLAHRINARFIDMMQTGAIEEVEALMARGLDPALPLMRAHGVPALIQYLQHKIALKSVIETGQLETRQYAKRQMTWQRNQMSDWLAFTPENAYEELIKRLKI